MILLPASSPPHSVLFCVCPEAGHCSCPSLPHPGVSFSHHSGPQASTLDLSPHPSGFSSEQPELHPSGSPPECGSRGRAASRPHCPRWFRCGHILLFIFLEHSGGRASVPTPRALPPWHLPRVPVTSLVSAATSVRPPRAHHVEPPASPPSPVRLPPSHLAPRASHVFSVSPEKVFASRGQRPLSVLPPRPPLAPPGAVLTPHGGGTLQGGRAAFLSHDLSPSPPPGSPCQVTFPWHPAWPGPPSFLPRSLCLVVFRHFLAAHLCMKWIEWKPSHRKENAGRCSK